MPTIQTLKRYIIRTNKKLDKQRNKMIYSKNLAQKIEAKDEIGELERKLLMLNQEVAFKMATINLNRLNKEWDKDE